MVPWRRKERRRLTYQHTEVQVFKMTPEQLDRFKKDIMADMMARQEDEVAATISADASAAAAGPARELQSSGMTRPSHSVSGGGLVSS